MDSKDLAPILAFAIVAVIIIVRQMLSHQRQMAELIHRNNSVQNANAQEGSKMQQDMQDLKQLVQQQAIVIDNLSNKIDKLSAQDPVQQRMKVAQ